MEGITIAPTERKNLIVRMKREIRPSRRLRMHITLLASEGYSATEIARVLYSVRAPPYTPSSVVSFGRGKRLSMTAEGEVLHHY